MQQALLQQAEAVRQAQHDRLASELAEARRTGKDTLAAALAQQVDAAKALQVAAIPTVRLLMRPSVMHTQIHGTCAGGSRPARLTQAVHLNWMHWTW